MPKKQVKKAKIPECPSCGEPVTYLLNEQVIIVNRPFNKDGSYDHDEMEELGVYEGEDSEYQCPDCGHCITNDESEAEDFLNGKKI